LHRISSGWFRRLTFNNVPASIQKAKEASGKSVCLF
jgi:hypothetical protein